MSAQLQGRRPPWDKQVRGWESSHRTGPHKASWRRCVFTKHVLWLWHFTHAISFPAQSDPSMGTPELILQMKVMRLRDVQWLA